MSFRNETTEDNATPSRPEDYVFVDKLRLVQPYYFDFKCWVKTRWEGLTLVQLFTKEFPMMTEEYYTRAFNAGRLRVEGRPDVTITTPMKTGMCIRHLVHRHEPPVLAGSVEVLSETEDFVAVSKPACMPVHTVGQYRKNTVMGVLEAERPDLGMLYPTYRLDKPVSGLLLLARSSAAAGKMRQQLEERSCSKSYLARVLGRFPVTVPPANAAAPVAGGSTQGGFGPAVATTINGHFPGADSDGAGPHSAPAIVASLTQSDALEATEGPVEAAALPSSPDGAEAPTPGPLPGVTLTSEGWLRVDVPLSWEGRTNHASAVPPGTCVGDPSDAASKDAITEFRFVSVSPDNKTSVVECRPLTGRTHQIRVHLQYMGHSIANDTQYGGTMGPALAFRRLQKNVKGPKSVPNAEADHKDGVKRARLGPLEEAREDRPCAVDGESPAPCAGVPPALLPSASTISPMETMPTGQLVQLMRPPAGIPENSVASEGPAAAETRPRTLGPSEPALFGAFGLNNPITLDLGSSDTQGRSLPETIRMLYSRDCYRVDPSLLEAVCPHCPCLVPFGYPIDLEPLWLHAIAYSGPGWAFTAPPPEWGEASFMAPPSKGEAHTLS